MSKYMVIDGNRIEFDKEKNILDLVRKAGIDYLLFVTIQIYQFMGHAECVWSRMKEVAF